MKNCTDITFILDRSGSMSNLRDDVIGGFNSFLEDQKKDKEEAVFSLIQFDNLYEENYIAKNIKEVEDLNRETYSPRGMTALRDAIGRTINNVGERLKKLSESDRPDKVIMVVQTDGFENDSKEFTQEKIEEMVKHQEEKYKWKFIFLGAGLDVAAQSGNIGFASMNTLAHGHTSKGYSKMYNTVSRSISGMKKMNAAVYANATAFTEKDKAEAEETIDNKTE